MNINFTIVFVASIVPLVTGFIWYHPKVFGNTWMQVSGMSADNVKETNMGRILGITFIMGVLLSFGLSFMVVHQFHLYSLVAGDPGLQDQGSDVSVFLQSALENYGSNYRTFRHGMLHGAIGGITVVMPAISVNALFERKPARYILIHSGYWITCLMIMGGIICRWI